MGLIEEFAFGRAGGVVAGRCEGGRAQSFDSGYFFGEGFGPGTARLEKRGPAGLIFFKTQVSNVFVHVVSKNVKCSHWSSPPYFCPVRFIHTHFLFCPPDRFAEGQSPQPQKGMLWSPCPNSSGLANSN